MNNKSLPSFGAVLNGIENVFAYIGGAVLLIMSFSIFYDILIRNISSFSAPWVMEVTQYEMVYFVFLAAPWILNKHGHVSFSLVVDHVDQRYRQALLKVAYVLGILGCLILTVCSFSLVCEYFSRNMVMESILSIPRWVAFIPIPLGGAVLTAEFLRQAFQVFSSNNDER
jgi:C4-dicarboxylate transporter DctQ subunit